MPPAKEKKKVTIYTDGGCDPNPGPGGYGVILIYGDAKKELSGGYRLTTNNRMEITAAIRGLEALRPPCAVTIYSDSQYLVNAIKEGWAKKWRENGWKRNRKDPALNPDLWQKLLDLCERHDVTFVWVRGHAGDEYNERCDALCHEARAAGNLPPDPGYHP